MGYSTRFEEALLFAHRLHCDQVRKGSETPYINHLLAVAALVGEQGGTEDQVIAALLHDAIEDQGGPDTGNLIRERFGETVVRIVEACSDTDVVPKPPWRARKEAYLQHLEHQGPEVLLVSVADKLHNARSINLDLRTIGPEVWQRFRTGREGSLWYYRSLVCTYRQIWSHPLIEELDRTVTEMERLAGDAGEGAP